MIQKSRGNFFDHNLYDPKIVSTQNFLDLKFFWNKKYVGSKKILDQKSFESTFSFEPTNSFWEKITFDQTFLGIKKHFGQNILWT